MQFSTLLHSVSYSGSWGQARLSVEQFIDKASELGYEGVMLMAKRPHLSILDYGAAERAKLRSQLESRNMRRICVAAYNNFSGDLEHPDVPQLEIQIQYLTEVARLTRDIGGDLVRVFTAYEHPQVSFAEQWQKVVTSLRECARRAAEFGVTIGVQNHHDIGVGFETQYELVRAVDEPNCRALFDAWSPVLHGADLNEAVRLLAPLTVHTTVANYRRLPRYRYEPGITNYAAQAPWYMAVPLDAGIIDYRGFLSAMQAGGFAGSVAYEMCSPLEGGGAMENLDCCARRFVEFMKEFRAATAVRSGAAAH